MARRCVGCTYTTDEPFQNNCPLCGSPLAIVCRTAGTRPAPSRGPDPSAPQPPRNWPLGKVLAGVAVLGVIAWVVVRDRPVAPAGVGRPADSVGKRVVIGGSIRQAVLALEPVPDTSGRVSLHDLLAPDAPKSGRFTWSDGHRSLVVTFRKGAITGVTEMDMGEFGDAGFVGPRHVTIEADPDPADPAIPPADADPADDVPIPPRRKSGP